MCENKLSTLINDSFHDEGSSLQRHYVVVATVAMTLFDIVCIKGVIPNKSHELNGAARISIFEILGSASRISTKNQEQNFFCSLRSQ